jgi:hypothetical protein
MINGTILSDGVHLKMNNFPFLLLFYDGIGGDKWRRGCNEWREGDADTIGKEKSEKVFLFFWR